ncbi:hypothetical protein BKA67DRAFT_664907 [Truncatella angustata]|uniref:Asl1-like glycosyl hydrolase catalytic domain-containing protein n=1 Tax=Truncatella angustata TaxID=152316 RepID=A0A9P8U8C7_9PEZI|nr:uncharacterized protein BKA67DRAFT_664907 [Truncatella angustata]KAH6645064.1 hypothetical protein BKA67DRAFT_664907 [Truncatella angustata]KAH8198429.1 hypothetical protein TruAng_007413 [Truncatella angustata]
MPSKRTLLWDYTLTRDFQNTPALRDTVGTLSDNGPLTTVINWNAWRPSELPEFFRFQPMVRTPAQLEGGEWDLINGSINAEIQKPGDDEVIVFTFNEPERIPLSPGDAAGLWRARLFPLRNQYGSRLKLVSPSCASDPAGNQWLEDFMGMLGDDEKPDYVGAHFYTSQDQSAEDGIAAAKDHLAFLCNKFGKALIVSEIASTSRDGGNVERFSHEIVDWMDAQGWIHAYALFAAMREIADGFVSPAAQLMDNEGRWTSLGRWWAGSS